jgi:hypothetical protein
VGFEVGTEVGKRLAQANLRFVSAEINWAKIGMLYRNTKETHEKSKREKNDAWKIHTQDTMLPHTIKK